MSTFNLDGFFLSLFLPNELSKLLRSYIVAVRFCCLKRLFIQIPFTFVDDSSVHPISAGSSLKFSLNILKKTYKNLGKNLTIYI